MNVLYIKVSEYFVSQEGKTYVIFSITLENGTQKYMSMVKPFTKEILIAGLRNLATALEKEN